MRNLSTILFLLLTLSSFGQIKFDQSKIATKTIEIVNDIEKVNIVMGNAVGYAGGTPEQYDNFIKLKNRATTDELRELINHPNSTVRCYAFWALSYDHSIDLFPIIIDHINDTAFVETQFGCIGSSEPVGDFFISLVTPRYIDGQSKKLDSSKFEALDSILIHTPTKLWARSSAISRAPITENLYPIIRELVTKEKNQSALVKLAMYKKEKDIELILNTRDKSENDEDGFSYIYRAICQFPHADFFPLLEANLQKTLDNSLYSNEWKVLYKAIASFRNEKALDLLLIPFTRVKHDNIKKYHIDFVFEAVQEINDPIYDELLWKLWSEENRITSDVFKYLSELNPDKAFELSKESLMNTDKMYVANISLNYGEPDATENLISQMLDLALIQDNEFGLEVIKTNIKKSNVHLFSIFSDLAGELKDKSFVEPLFDRLKTEWNAHVYLEIVEALISYKDNEINKRIIEIRKKNKNLTKDWGGEALDKLLKDNNIK